MLKGVKVADNLNVFVKREPTKTAKERLGRYRLISGVSLVDTMVDRILFGWLARLVVQKATKTPCMVGWAPIRGGWRLIPRLFRDNPVVCLDKSSWDWTVLPWMIQAFEQFVLELAVNPPLWWVDMVKLRFSLLYHHAIYQFSDGTEVLQEEMGIQKSGSLLTIIFNSVLQSICHYVAMDELGYEPTLAQPIVLGDDTVQLEPPSVQQYIQALERLGPKIKEFKIHRWVEFAGFAFTRYTCVPAYWKKHLFELKYTENAIETLRSYQIIYAREPEMFAFLESLLGELDPTKAYTRRFCLQVFDEAD